MVSLRSTVSLPENVMFHEMEGEAVILNTDTGKYFGLNQVGTRMWQLLIENGGITPAYDALLSEYEVDGDRLKTDLLHLIDELSTNGLLQVDDPEDAEE